MSENTNANTNTNTENHTNHKGVSTMNATDNEKNKPTCGDMLRDTVRNFGRDLERIASGELFFTDDGETTTEATYTNEDGEEIEREPVSVFDYFEKHALNIENWKINRDGECVGGDVLLCYGGPTVWATERGVFGAWGNDRADYQSSAAGEVVEEFLRETMPKF